MTVMTEQQIVNARLLTLRAMLKLEMKGMKRSRAPSAYSMLKQLGYKGSREVVLAQLDKERQEILTGVMLPEA
jgi:succinylarginine dihydrolase